MKKHFLYCILLFSSFFYGQQNLLELAEKHLFSNQDSAYYYLDSLYVESFEQNEWIKAMEASNYINFVSGYHKNISKFSTSLQREDSLYDDIKDNIDALKDGTYNKHAYWFDKGNYYYKIYEYAKATDYFFKLLNSVEKLPDSIVKNTYSDFLTATNSYLATIYSNEYKYEIAEEFYDENLRLHSKFEDSKDELLDTKNLIAALKSFQKDYKTSNEYAKESIDYYLNNNTENHLNSLLSTSLLLMNNYLKLNQPDSAKIYLMKIRPHISKRIRFKANFLELSAKISVAEGNFEKALSIYIETLQVLNLSHGSRDDAALMYKKIGDLYFLTNDLKKALEYFEKAFQLYYPQTNNKIDSNIKLRANSKTNVLQIINALSKIHNTSGKKTGYQKNIIYGTLAIDKLNELRKSFNDDTDKQTLVENVLPIFEHGIEASYQLYKTSQNTAYIDTAFVFFERSKSTILLDALYKNNATKFSGIPDDLLEKEKILKVTIAQLEKKIKTQDKKIQDQLFKYKREYETLIQNIEANHPAYFDLKHNTEVASILKVQKSLNPGEMVLSYFYGDKAVYIISITNKDKFIFKISTDAIDIQNILELQKMIGDPKTNISNLAEVSFSIYEKFVASTLTNKAISKLLIMPDGTLRNIPFEALNTSNNGIDYLINDLNISYINSATLWFQLQNKNKKQKASLLAFAPSFNEHSEFSKLPNTIREVEDINQFFTGKIFVENEATLENFKTNIENHNIIHLATHAQTDNELPEYSFLAFSPNEKEENLIYVNDLYAMHINAELVTLSACKSGVGDLKKGEGLLSISRAFYYAGAKSLVYTLWNINDSSSSEIMKNFYENLSKGVPKDEALRNAKLIFLEKHKENKFAHPYYWSSFIVSGNTKSLTSKSNRTWYIVGGTLLLILLLFRKKLL